MTYAHDEPSLDELAAIEAEAPLIDAELDLVDAEIRVITDPSDAIAKRAHRRAKSALLSLLVQLANHDAAIDVAPVYTITDPRPAGPAEAA